MEKSTSKEDKKLKGRTATFSEINPIEFDENGFYITKRGRIVFAFEMEMPEMESLTHEDYESLNYMFVKNLKGLPVDTVVHKQDIFHTGRRRLNTSPGIEPGYFRQKIEQHFSGRPVLYHQSYLFVSFPVGKKEPKPSASNTLLSAYRNTFPNTLVDIEKRIEDAVSIMGGFTSTFNTMRGLKLRRVYTQEMRELLYRYSTLDYDYQSGMDPEVLKEIRRDDGNHARFFQLNRGFLNDLNCAAVGENRVNIISLTKQGDSVSTSVTNANNMPGPFTDLMNFDLYFPHIVNQVIRVGNTEAELKKIDSSRKIMNSWGKYRNQDTDIQSGSLENFTANIRAENGQLVWMGYNVTVWDSDQDELKHKIDEVTTAFKALNGATCFVETMDTMALYIAGMPCNGSEYYRLLLCPSEEAACYTNFVTSFKPQTGIFYLDRFGQPIELDLWVGNAKNKLVIGPTGSGKSYNVNHMLTEQFEAGDDQVIIDVGGSYKNMVATLEGKYYEYSQEKPLSFNPFTIPMENGRYILDSEKADFLVTLIGVMWKEEGVELGKNETVILVNFLDRYYGQLPASGKQPGFNGFYAFVEKMHADSLADESNTEYRENLRFFDMQSFRNVLSQFVSGGKYESVLNASANLDLTNERLICFDMDGVKSDRQLYPIVSLLIIELIMDKIRHRKGVRKHVFMDEAWSMLSDNLGEFVEYMYRTIRKQNGAMTIITQGIEEIIGNPKVGSAIINNTNVKILLDHSANTQSLPLLQKHLGLTDHEISLLTGLKKDAGWREFFIKISDYAKVYRLEVTPFANANYSTDPKDRLRMRRLIDKFGGNVEYATAQFIEETTNF